MTEAEVISELQLDSSLNLARKQFYHWREKIDRALGQKEPISPTELRSMEFEAVLAIVAAYNRADSLHEWDRVNSSEKRNGTINP